jgi:hypothetical protein
MGYDEYLFSCLLKEYDEDFASLPYDEQFDNLPRLYKEFEKSPFNEREESLYACIERYLLDKEANQNDEMDLDDDELDYII